MNEIDTRLVNTLLSQGFQIHTYRIIDQSSAVVTWAEGTDEVTANAALALFDWSESAHVAWRRDQAATAIKFNGDFTAMVMAMVHEINILRQWITDFKSVVFGAGSLAALKTGVAGLPNLPDRTKIQAVTLLKAKRLEE